MQIFQKKHPGVEPEVLTKEDKPAASNYKNIPERGNYAKATDSLLKLRFTENGETMIFKGRLHFDGLATLMPPFGHQPPFYNSTWTIVDVICLTTPEAKVSSSVALGSVVLSSHRYSPAFFQKFRDVMAMVTQEMNRQTQLIMQDTMNKIRSMNRSLTAENRQALESTSRAQDNSVRNFCDYLGDRERYSDGSTEFIMPSGYNRAATDGQGNYVLTNSASYNPVGNWHELRKVH